jgi:hypothetical protein
LVVAVKKKVEEEGGRRRRSNVRFVMIRFRERAFFSSGKADGAFRVTKLFQRFNTTVVVALSKRRDEQGPPASPKTEGECLSMSIDRSSFVRSSRSRSTFARGAPCSSAAAICPSTN